MSVVTLIRDYIETVNTQIDIQENSVYLFSVISETFPHIFKMCKNTLWYLVSFQGLRDNFYQPYLDNLNNDSKAIVLNNVFGSLSKSSTYGEPQTLSTVASFFFNGFGNSFFLSLPGSIGTLLILRRILLQGVPAGLVGTLGGVLSNCLIIIAVTFGSRVLVLSPAFLDLLFYIGLLIPGFVILRGLCYSDFRIISVKETKALISIGVMHFLLGLSNQSTLLKHFRDLTIMPDPTRFLGISDNISRLFYILGFSIGSFIFALCAFFGFVFLLNWWLARSTITRSRLMKVSENLSIVFLTGLSISTFSYYGTDFLLTKGFGFVPADCSFSQTVLVPNSLFKDPHNLTGVHALYPSNEFSLDPAPFDRPLEKYYRRSVLLKEPFFKYRSFEELNYQGEKHWLHRGFRHGSAKPIKPITLPAEKNKLVEGRTLLRSLDKAIGWVDESEKKISLPKYAFTNRAKQPIEFNFETSATLGQGLASGPGQGQGPNATLSEGLASQNIEIKPLTSSINGFSDFRFLEQKFKRFFFGQIGLLPGRLPNPSGPFDSQEMAHKRLAFTNPVYKALLSFDIDLFLKRQPSTQSLSAEDEHNIYLKRQLLERYINTQRDYFDGLGLGFDVRALPNSKPSEALRAGATLAEGRATLNTLETTDASLSLTKHVHNNPLSKALPTIFDSTENNIPEIGVSETIKNPSSRFFNPSKSTGFIKSLANQSYKHQFKGTLEIVRQMFAVSLDCPEPSSVAGGGAWDKALSNNEIGKNFFQDDKGLVIPRPLNPRIIKFDQPLYTQTKCNEQKTQTQQIKNNRLPFSSWRTSKTFSSFGHEELYNSFNQNLNKSYTINHHKPFLESASISPFYIGWDSDRRQLLLTRRFLARKDALIFKHQIFGKELKNDKAVNDAPQKLKLGKDQEHSQSKVTSFATWPLIKPDLTDKLTANWRIPSRSFEQMVALEEEARMGLDEPSDTSKGLRGSYDTFSALWNKNFLQEMPQQIPPFRVNRWPNNITTPAVQSDLDSFDQIEGSLFTGVKRGGFLWPGSTSLKVKLTKN